MITIQWYDVTIDTVSFVAAAASKMIQGNLKKKFIKTLIILNLGHLGLQL